MRKVFVILIAAVATFGLLAPPAVFAQAAAPAPKVTISGLVDFVTAWLTNVGTENSTARDITNASDKNSWYSRERGVFTLTGEVGRSKGVVALEFDFHNGRSTTNFDGGGFGGNAGLDLETDEKSNVEVKWLYLETPITGPGSLMPFLPVDTVGRFGAQPARGHDYKPGILFTGDFPGVALETKWAPNLRSTLTFAQIEERFDRVTNPIGTAAGQDVSDDWAFLASVEVDVFKGLTVKPTYAYLTCDDGCEGNSGNRQTSGAQAAALGTGNFARGGFDPSTTAFFGRNAYRHTFGGDVKWTAGPFSVAPTFLYQWGQQEIPRGTVTSNTSKDDVKIRSWIADIIGGFRSGPLTVEVRGMWTPGMEASDCVQTISVTGFTCTGGDKIKYYEPIMNGTTSYFSGWSEIDASGIDYNVSLRETSGTQLGRSPSYDKYGRRVLAAAVDYALTPALTFHLVTNFQWTDEKVDREATLIGGTGTGSLSPVSKGDKRYLGNEWDAGFTYRFAPNVAFDLIGAALFVGDARDNGHDASSVTDHYNAKDVYKAAARIRLTW